MPTTLPRVNVSFQRPTYEALERISQVEHASLAEVVSKLVSYALDLSEDLYLAGIAEKRLKNFQRDDALTSDEVLRWNRTRKKKPG